MKINLTSNLRKLFNKNYIEIDLDKPKPIGEVIYSLGEQNPEIINLLFKEKNVLWDGIIIISNGNIEKNLSKEIDNQSELTILLPAAGG